MDAEQVSMIKKPEAKSARPVSAEAPTRTRAVLDAVAPYCAPLSEHWDAERKRRSGLRTPEHLTALLTAQRAYGSARSVERQAAAQRRLARRDSQNPLSAARRAARTAQRAAKTHRRASKIGLKLARRSYPSTLMSVAVRAHAGHALPAGITSYVLSTPADWTMWPASTSVALIAANIGALALGRRAPSVQVDAGLTAEETRLAERLDPSYWAQHADDRGLSGTVPTPAEITQAGLVSHVRLDAKWTPGAFKGKAAEIRALLGARTDLRMEIKSGSHGDRATITLRTRSASDGLDLMGWRPGDAWAVDTVTGETVPVPLGKRILIAGTSGSGKSTSARPLLAEASERADHRLVILDRKYIEGRTWEHRARIACELDEMRAVVEELIAEGEERLKQLPRGEDTVTISPTRPRITVFVDEMGELLSDCAAKYKDEDGKAADYLDVIAGLRTVARKYRAAEIILVPATQKPTLTGDGHGLDSQIAGQLTVRLALAVATSTETQSVFGQDAIEKGWKAHELPMPWVALMRDQDKGPNQRTSPIRMRWMTAQQVIDLPDRPIWQRGAAPVTAPEPVEHSADSDRPALRLIRGEATTSRPVESESTGRDAVQLPPAEREVLDALLGASEPMRHRDLASATGRAGATVSKAVGRLVERGYAVRDEAAKTTTATPAAKETSA